MSCCFADSSSETVDVKLLTMLLTKAAQLLSRFFGVRSKKGGGGGLEKGPKELTIVTPQNNCF